MTHTNFTKVTRMVLIKVGTAEVVRTCHGALDRKGKQRTDGGADHQRDHDHRDACGAFLHDRDRARRVHGACGSSTSVSALFSTCRQKTSQSPFPRIPSVPKPSMPSKVPSCDPAQISTFRARNCMQREQEVRRCFRMTRRRRHAQRDIP